MVYWFPKAFGFKLNERLGKYSFWCWFIGFFMAFMPLYILGFMGMTRRLNHYDNPAWQPYLIVAWVGAVIIALGIFFLLLQIFVSIRDRKKNVDFDGDPWGGRTLEWSIPSPPPFYNFAKVPQVSHLDQFWHDKETGVAYQRPARYEDIHMPRNTGAGVYIGVAGLAHLVACGPGLGQHDRRLHRPRLRPRRGLLRQGRRGDAHRERPLRVAEASRVENPPYALTRAPQGAMRVDRQSRIHRILGRVAVYRCEAPVF